MATYRIVRLFQDSGVSSRVIKRGLTLEKAQEHCNDPETSSRTCTTSAAKQRTKKYGAWFDSYTEE